MSTNRRVFARSSAKKNTTRFPMGTQKTVTNRALNGFLREANSTRSPADTKKTNNRALGDDDVLTLSRTIEI